MPRHCVIPLLQRSPCKKRAFFAWKLAYSAGRWPEARRVRRPNEDAPVTALPVDVEAGDPRHK